MSARDINKSLCDEPHPTIDGVLCDKKTHLYGPHSNRRDRQDWEGLPIPVVTKSTKIKASDAVNNASPETRTGPPTGILTQERVQGIRQVTSNTPEDWAEAFDRYVAGLQRGARFDVYEVLDAVGRPEGVHPSAHGARMRIASRQGLVVKVGHSERVAHGDDVTLWERA